MSTRFRGKMILSVLLTVTIVLTASVFVVANVIETPKAAESMNGTEAGANYNENGLSASFDQAFSYTEAEQEEAADTYEDEQNTNGLKISSRGVSSVAEVGAAPGISVKNVGKIGERYSGGPYLTCYNSNGGYLFNFCSYFINDSGSLVNSNPNSSTTLKNSNVAFCLEAIDVGPEDNAKDSYEPKMYELTPDMIISAPGGDKNTAYKKMLYTFYYGWNGPKNLYSDNNYSRGYIDTEYLAGYNYNNDKSNRVKSGYVLEEHWTEFVKEVKVTNLYKNVSSATKDSNNPFKVYLSYNDSLSDNKTLSLNTSTLNTGRIKLVGANGKTSSVDTKAYIRFTVPSGFTCKVSRTAAHSNKSNYPVEYKSGTTATIFGAESFYFHADRADVSGAKFKVKSCYGRVYILKTKNAYDNLQDLAQVRYNTTIDSTITIPVPNRVKFSVNKQSAFTGLTNAAQFSYIDSDGNRVYPYKNLSAKYTVYTNAACTTPLKDINGKTVVITTNAATGKGSVTATVKSFNKKYYIKETTAPLNGGYYAKDSVGYPVTTTDTGTLRTYYSNTTDKTVPLSEENPLAILSIKKKPVSNITNSDGTLVTNLYSTISIEGAKYAVYKDEACTSPLLLADSKTKAVITIDKNGSGALTVPVTQDTYYIKEQAPAPVGLNLDKTVYSISMNKSVSTGGVKSNGQSIYNLLKAVNTDNIDDVILDTINSSKDANGNIKNVYDSLIYYPVDILIQKKNAFDAEDADPKNANPSLQGAEFEISYYNGLYTQENIGEQTPQRTWTLVTDANGQVKLGDSYRAEGDNGDSFYYIAKNADGESGETTYQPVVPYGTLTIKETKAPDGYKINSELFIRQITDASETITDSSGEAVLNEVVVEEEPDELYYNTVDILIQKKNALDAEDADPKDANPSLAGAVFEVKYYSDLYDTQAEIIESTLKRTWTLVTDANGQVKLEDSYRAEGDGGDSFYYIENADSETGETTYQPIIPYGTVTVKEIKAPDGYKINKELFIRQITNESTSSIVVELEQVVVEEEPAKQLQFKIQKTSLVPIYTTGDSNYSLKDAEYTVYTDPDCKESLKLRNGEDVVIVTDENGAGTSEIILLNDDPLDTYYIQETKAPKGFELDNTVYTVSDPSEDGTLLIFSASVEDTPLATIVIKKKASQYLYDADGNVIVNPHSVKGATYTIYKSASVKIGQISLSGKVATVTTDEDGYAKVTVPITSSVQKYFYLKETSAPDGYAKDPTVYAVSYQPSGGSSAASLRSAGSTDETVGRVYKYLYTVGINKLALTYKAVSSNILTDDFYYSPVDILIQKRNALDAEDADPKDAKPSLAGAEFTLKYYTGTYSDSSTPERTWVLTTDENGQVKLDSNHFVSGDSFYHIKTTSNGETAYEPIIPYGTLTIKETKAPDGYLIDDTTYVRQIVSDTSSTGDEYVIAGNVVNTVEVAETPIAKLSITKAAAPILYDKTESADDKIIVQSPYSVDGASYCVYTDADCTTHLQANGENVVFEIGKDGTFGAAEIIIPLTGSFDYERFYFKEEKAPVGYAIDKNVYSLGLNSDTTKGLLYDQIQLVKTLTNDDGTTSIEYEDIEGNTVLEEPYYSPINILIKKTDAKTSLSGPSLAGAEFEIKYYAGQYETEADIDKSTLQRTWILTTIADADGNAIVKMEDSYRAKSDSGQSFYYVNDKAVIPYGTVTIRETKAPIGYQLNETLFIRRIVAPVEVGPVQENAVEAGQTVNTVQVKEQPGATIKFKKASATTLVDSIKDGQEISRSVAGAVYKIYRPNSETGALQLTDDYCVATVQTDKDGIAMATIEPSDDNPDKYYIKEVIPPKGYTLDETVYAVSKNDSVTSLYDKLSAVNSNGELVAVDAVYDKLYYNTADLLLKKESANEALAELEDPDESLNGAVFEFKYYDTIIAESDLDNAAPTRTWLLKTGKGSVNDNGAFVEKNGIIKLEEDFKCEGSDDFYYLKTLADYSESEEAEDSTDSGDTEAKEEEFEYTPVIPYGTLVITEKTAPDGYKLYDGSIIKYIDYSANDGVETTVEYEPVTVKENGTSEVKIIKKSPDGNIEGIAFTVEDIEYGTQFDVVTDENGEIIVDNLRGGATYKITEKELLGYETLEPQEVTLVENETAEVSFDNIPVTDLKIIKEAQDGNVEANISNIYFDVFADGELIKTVNTNSEGIAIIEKLPVYSKAGEDIEYSVKEKGVLQDDGTYAIPERYGEPSISTYQRDNTIIFRVTNHVESASLVIYKEAYDSGNPLQGVKFELYRRSTDETGSQEDEQMYFYKMDEGEYVVSDSDNLMVTTEVVTDANGHIKITGLAKGQKYYLKETATQGGYILPANGEEMVMTKPEEEITVLNIPGFSPTTAGGMGTIPTVCVGIALIMAAAALAYYRFKMI